jgi:hypothetical protein
MVASPRSNGAQAFRWKRFVVRVVQQVSWLLGPSGKNAIASGAAEPMTNISVASVFAARPDYG